MNSSTEQGPTMPPPPHRSSFCCDRHPTKQFTGFCPSCLCERLTTLELSSAFSSCRLSSAKAAALKSVFKSKQTVLIPQQQLQPELWRSQSFSASKNECFLGVFEPQQHPCDVTGRSSLCSRLNLDNDNHRKSSASLIDQQQQPTQIDEEEEEEDEEEEEEENLDFTNEAELFRNEDNFICEDEIRVCQDKPTLGEEQQQQVEIKVGEEIEEEFKTIKEHIDLDSHAKKPSSSSVMDLKDIAGSFWSAASVFSKKWQKWRQKQKLKKRQQSRRGGPTLPIEKPIARQYCETQSEIADYGYGRHSCDTEPARFSLDNARISFDAAQMSFDDVRPYFDEPRASWDGYLIGGCGSRSFPRLPPVLSMIKDSLAAVHVVRSDMQIPAEEDEKVPGSSTQTREYYSDSSRCRKSLDRSNSIRKTAAAVVAEMEELKVGAKAKIIPTTVEHRVSVDSNSNSFRDDCSETFQLTCRDNGSVIETAERKGLKKSHRWKNIWGLIIKRAGGTKGVDEDEWHNTGNGVERTLSKSWQELRRESNDETRGGFNMSMLRSNSSVNQRNSNCNGGLLKSARKTVFETSGRKKIDAIVLGRNQSSRYSPNNIDNGLLRFYLTPPRGSCRRVGGGGLEKSRANNSHSIIGSVLRLY